MHADLAVRCTVHFAKMRKSTTACLDYGVCDDSAKITNSKMALFSRNPVFASVEIKYKGSHNRNYNHLATCRLC